MPTKKKSGVPVLRVKDGASESEILATARAKFTAADLQQFAETEEGVPAQQVLAEMQEVHRRNVRKRTIKSRNNRR